MKADLCKSCAEFLKRKGHDLVVVQGESDREITCAKCGRKRPGNTYEEARADGTRCV